MLFRTFSPRLEDIDTFQCSSDSFSHWPNISGCVQSCQNYILMYHCSPIAGRGEGPENLSRIGPIVICLFRTFSPHLKNNNTSKCSSDSFAHTLRYVVNVENCRNYIEMYQCPPIAGKRSLIALTFAGLRISEWNISNLRQGKLFAVFSRPGQNQGLLYKHCCHSVIHWLSPSLWRYIFMGQPCQIC